MFTLAAACSACTPPAASFNLLDWTFWQSAFALVAIIVSVGPYIVSLFKKGLLVAEVYERISVTHVLGNPNVNLHIAVRNIGGKPIRIRSMTLSIVLPDQNTMVLGMKTYARQNNPQLIFSSQVLKPGEEEFYNFTFFNVFSRHEDIQYRELTNDFIADLREKRSHEPDMQKLVHVSNELLVRAETIMNRHFRWMGGDNHCTLNIETEATGAKKKFRFGSSSLLVTSKFRFLLMESDIALLKSYNKEFSHGLGILQFDSNIQRPVFVERILEGNRVT
ncbi:hypothetical protein ACO0LO_22300 [Undibacterium sp. TJN25]|uniref:hypothetical protein n=1 Tax=Undibacterium sp. TJN25 TaxID=3413056 RepID=UPI003BF35C13